ncbi:YchJ family protein [Photorhabdus aegyptia]|uniref:UPF0225 protein BA1DRAFT_01290 n=1 Tax=Photorhabdus aegyptia TaxID=2805098 RepID=A0A022PKC7_9GAMM|nr:YchJ family protein [Photorhabdus aegyptia]EYU16126.1 hypothetical protein BA1DRAFT_01290 [Photorhabdus aegyptia]
MTERCPCGSGIDFADCCSPYLQNIKFAPTAESLMRSRYSAYVKHNADYLITSWHPDCQAEKWRLDLEQSFIVTQWLGLNVITTEKGKNDNEAYVEFSACFLDQKSQDKQLIHERSRFLRIDQRWYYIDGVKPIDGIKPIDGVKPQIGRNSPCPCGSGKKYKKCCG